MTNPNKLPITLYCDEEEAEFISQRLQNGHRVTVKRLRSFTFVTEEDHLDFNKLHKEYQEQAKKI